MFIPTRSIVILFGLLATLPFALSAIIDDPNPMVRGMPVDGFQPAPAPPTAEEE
jgi:hypothetical protein